MNLRDVIDPTKSIEIGKLYGAQLLVTGSIAKLKNSLVTHLRLVDTKTGQIVGSLNNDILIDDEWS